MQMCQLRHRLSADDLLVLLAVGRSGRYVTAAEELGINHTTIARRIAALEQSIGGRLLARVAGGWELTDLGREALSAAEAVEVRGPLADGGSRGHANARGRRPDVGDRRLQRLRRRARRRPGADGATRRWRSRSSPRPGARPSSAPVSTSRSSSANRRCTAPRPSGSATTGWVCTARATTSPNTAPRRRGAELAGHPLVYFIDSMLQVDDLDLARTFAPTMRESVTSTNVFVHVEATRAVRRTRSAAVLHGRPARRSGPGAARRGRDPADLLAGDPARDTAPARGGRRRRARSATGCPTSATCCSAACGAAE